MKPFSTPQLMFLDVCLGLDPCPLSFNKLWSYCFSHQLIDHWCTSKVYQLFLPYCNFNRSTRYFLCMWFLYYRL